MIYCINLLLYSNKFPRFINHCKRRFCFATAYDFQTPAELLENSGMATLGGGRGGG